MNTDKIRAFSLFTFWLNCARIIKRSKEKKVSGRTCVRL